MKFIGQLCFEDCSGAAIELYQEVFGAKVKTLLHYKDAVEYGWASPCPEKDHYVYHSEHYFGNVEVRIMDLCSKESIETTRKVEHLIGMDTAEEVEKAFAMLAEDGEVVRELERPPYMVIIGSVRDKFGILWTLMCDFA